MVVVRLTTGSQVVRMATKCIDQSRLAGLNGENQIVGMGDTGIDWLHCTFTDSAHSGPGSGPYLTETAATGGYTYWVSTTHRKIVYYRQVDDNVDANGHGTHCAGSAVGSLQSPGQHPQYCCVQRSTASFTCVLCLFAFLYCQLCDSFPSRPTSSPLIHALSPLPILPSLPNPDPPSPPPSLSLQD